MIIPYQMLTSATLEQLIKDFITRDGTDNGDETPLLTRIQRVKHVLEKKQAFIVFDTESESCSLVLKQDIPQQWLNDLA